MNAQNSGLTPSRRTLVKGAAWSVPVVAMAAPAHAVGASQCVTYTVGEGSFKCPGQSTDRPFGYGIRFCITNTCPTTSPCQSISLVLGMPVTSNNGSVLVPDEDYGTVPMPSEVCPGQGTVCSTDVYYFSSDSSAGTIYFYVSINGGTPVQVSMKAPPNCPKSMQTTAVEESSNPAAEEKTAVEGTEGTAPEADVSSEAPASEAPASEAPADVAPTTETGTEGDGTVETTENNG